MLTDTERNKNLFRIFKTRIYHSLCQITECHCSYGTLYGLTGLNEKLEELKDMMQYAFSLPDETILSRELVESTVYRELEYPDYLEQSIYREIRSGRYDKVRVIGEQFARYVIDSESRPACIREYVLRFAAGILRVAGETRGSLEAHTGISEPHFLQGNRGEFYILSAEFQDQYSQTSAFIRQL